MCLQFRQVHDQNDYLANLLCCIQGLVIDRIRGSLPSKTRFIYVGDGKGDYCPTLNLEGCDFVMPRKNYPLWKQICSDPKLVDARVHDWSSGEELETILLNLISKLTSTTQLAQHKVRVTTSLTILTILVSTFSLQYVQQLQDGSNVRGTPSNLHCLFSKLSVSNGTDELILIDE